MRQVRQAVPVLALHRPVLFGDLSDPGGAEGEAVMLRTHVTLDPGPISLYPVGPDQEDEAGYLKPAGFWYEVDGDWRRWCAENEWGREELRHLYEVTLADCRVLRIRNHAAMEAFNRRFGRRRPAPAWCNDTVIDWGLVATEFDGVEVAPYRWECRLDDAFRWYYGWDCASGVIWQPRGATVSYVGPLIAETVACPR